MVAVLFSFSSDKKYFDLKRRSIYSTVFHYVSTLAQNAWAFYTDFTPV